MAYNKILDLRIGYIVQNTNDKSLRILISLGQKYTAIVKQEGDWWIGWIEEIPGVNCQERTRDELMKSLKITLKETLTDLQIAKSRLKDKTDPIISVKELKKSLF